MKPIATLIGWVVLIAFMATIWPLLILSLLLALAVALFLRHLLRLSKGRPKRPEPTNNQKQREAIMAENFNAWSVTIQAVVITNKKHQGPYHIHDNLTVECDGRWVDIQDLKVVRLVEQEGAPQSDALDDAVDGLVTAVRMTDKIEKGEA